MQTIPLLCYEVALINIQEYKEEFNYTWQDPKLNTTPQYGPSTAL